MTGARGGSSGICGQVRPRAFPPTAPTILSCPATRYHARWGERCQALYQGRIKILDLYEELPAGPYYKEFEQFPE